MHIRSLSLNSQFNATSKPLRILPRPLGYFRSYSQLMRQVLVPRTALLLALSIWGNCTQAQTAVPTSAEHYSYVDQGIKEDTIESASITLSMVDTSEYSDQVSRRHSNQIAAPYFYIEQDIKVGLVESSKFVVSVIDTSEYSDQASRNQLNKINNRINQQAEAAQLNYIGEIGDAKKQIFLWEKSSNNKVGGLFSNVYQPVHRNNEIIPIDSDYLVPTGGILVETQDGDTSNLMTWIREQGRNIQQIANSALYWIDTGLGEDAVSIAAEISDIQGIKTAKPSFKRVKLP